MILRAIKTLETINDKAEDLHQALSRGGRMAFGSV